MASRPVRVENGLGTGGVSCLGIDRSTGHVRNGGVSSAELIEGVSERVVLGGRLDIPDITTVAAELAALDRICNVLFVNNCASRSINLEENHVSEAVA